MNGKPKQWRDKRETEVTGRPIEIVRQKLIEKSTKEK